MSSRSTLLVRMTIYSLIYLRSYLIRMPRVQILQEWKDQPLRQRNVVFIRQNIDLISTLFTYLVRTTQGQGLMPDKTTRFKCKGKDIYHFVRFPVSVNLLTESHAYSKDGYIDILSVYSCSGRISRCD
jgi:hypothetical protein